MLWRIHPFGPYIVLLIVVALVALAILRSRRGRGWPGPRFPGPAPGGAATVPSVTAPMTRQARAAGDLGPGRLRTTGRRQTTAVNHLTTGPSDHRAVVRA